MNRQQGFKHWIAARRPGFSDELIQLS